MVPERNRSSPIRMKSGIEAREVIEEVSRILLASIGNPDGPMMT